MTATTLRYVIGFVFIVSFAGGGFMQTGVAQTANLPGGSPMFGTVVRLDRGPWLLATDPRNVGRDQEWWKAPRAEARAARVPGIIQETFPGYHGVAWYWREFEAPGNSFPAGRTLLRFWAVDYFAQVWVNDVVVGQHEGGETPFVLDITDAVKPNAVNRVAVRVVNPAGEPIDGMVLNETPHRNKTVSLTVGGSYNYGGITEPVELLCVPAVRIADVFVRADWKTGKVVVEANVRNASVAAAKGKMEFVIRPGKSSEAVAETSLQRDLPVGDTAIKAELQVRDHRLWDVEEPNLYVMTAELATDDGKSQDECRTQFGFRDFRVERGYFRLNGKRIFVRSSHTGNHCPVGQILPPDEARDLLRKDLIYAKASGFNMVRFIAGIAHPYQLDMCDEIGLMVHEETLAGWCLADSPKMAERFDLSIREAILRDRNHPCLTILGLLNETQDGPIFRHAVDSLALVRSLDDTRLVLLGSGRWDGRNSIGSVSNPGSAQWECEWGVESADNTVQGKWGAFGGYFNGAGDAHVYPATPHTPEIESGIRNLGRDTKPVFLSEYGIGSLMNAVQELRTYEQHNINPELEDFIYFRNTVDKLNADWARFGLDGVYAFPEDMLDDSQRLHCRQRLLGFDLIRSNPKICGYNLTGLLDHGFTGEGLWTYWREWKPGITDALKNGWAPLRWCPFVSPMNGYANRPFTVEAVLANEDVLTPGDYPVTLRILGPKGIAWETKTQVTIPKVAAGEDGPLAVPVFKGEIKLDGPAGAYQFAANMERGGAPAGGRLTFHVSEVARPDASGTIAVWGIDEKVQTWLKAQGVNCTPLEAAPRGVRQVILVGDVSTLNPSSAQWVDLLKRVAEGSVAVFASPAAFKRGDNAVGWLPVKNKGRLYDFPDWLYHKECIAKSHAIFNGLQSKGIMDWDYYGPVISHKFLDGQDTPDEVVAVAIALCHSAPPGGYASGTMLGAYNFGAGKVIVNTLQVIENIDAHPTADRLLLNMITYAASSAGGTVAPLPDDFDARMKEIAFE